MRHAIANVYDKMTILFLSFFFFFFCCCCCQVRDEREIEEKNEELRGKIFHSFSMVDTCEMFLMEEFMSTFYVYYVDEISDRDKINTN